jgi:hypothetical protein
MFRLRSLQHRGLLVARRSTISTLHSLASPRPPIHVYVCPYVCAVHSRLVQVQPEVGLAGPNSLVLGACGVLVGPCLPTGAVQVSVALIRVAILHEFARHSSHKTNDDLLHSGEALELG